jgi:hypothetical protein
MSAARGHQVALHTVHAGGLPVVGDDAVPLTEHVGQVVDLDQGCRDRPGRLHRLRQPLPRGLLVLGCVAQVADQMADLGRATLAFEEEHSVDLQGSGAVQVLCPFVGAEHRARGRLGGGPLVGKRLEGTGVALQYHGELAW